MTKSKGKIHGMQLLLIVIGAFLVADTIFARCISNFNLGVILPAIIGAPLLIVGLFYDSFCIWFLTPVGRFLQVFFICIYTLGIVSVIVCTAIIETYATRKAEDGKDAVIVLGAALHGAEPSNVLKWRLDAAYDYWQDNKNSVIVLSGGRGREETVTEASAMHAYMISRGIPKDSLIIEDRSRDTAQNFLYSEKLLDEYFAGRKYSVAFVTSHFHVFRAGIAAKNCGLDAEGIAAYNAPWLVINYYLRETVALLRYYFMGVA